MIGKLAIKIAAASNDVGGKLNPDKRNQDQKYDYVSADKILAVCGQALAAQGVVVFPGIIKSEVVMTERTGKSSRYDATIELGITVTDGESEYACAWLGMGSDYMTPDKALYKAITSGHKYFLMKLLNVGAGNEDGEHEPPPSPPRQRKEGQPEQRQPAVPPKPVQPTNGKQAQADPPGFEVWADWTQPADAIAWGMSQGVFKAKLHAENAYGKVKDTCKPTTAKAMWQCWYEDVQRRIAEADDAGRAQEFPGEDGDPALFGDS